MSDDQNHLKQNDTQAERIIECHPVKVNDPSCEHKWQFAFVDSEGYTNERCEKCPMGRRIFG